MKLISIIFTLLLFGTLCFAVETVPSNSLKANIFEMQYEKVACRADFYTATLDSVQNSGLNVSVDQLKSLIDMHKEALKVAADNEDSRAFNDALKLLQDDSKQLIITYANLKNVIPRGVAGKEIKTKLKQDFNSNMDTRNSCIKDTSIVLGKVQLEYVKNWKESAETTVENLKAKGVDTSKMEEIISDLQLKIDTMDDVLATDDVNQIEIARKNIREEHLHIWARFQIARVDALLGAIESKATEKGLTVQVQEIRTLLSDADSKVTVGKAYDEGEFQQVQETLKQAVTKLRSLFKSVN
ncbi:MAG: hypothetical protein Q7S22_04375 [Candidatus Micrarchaeota archaeon]|nr:hypothetical protein [Candidatus Micrarchaeota archaeon]